MTLQWTFPEGHQPKLSITNQGSWKCTCDMFEEVWGRLQSPHLSSSPHPLNWGNQWLKLRPFSTISASFISKAFMEHFSRSFLVVWKTFQNIICVPMKCDLNNFVKDSGRPTKASNLWALSAWWNIKHFWQLVYFFEQWRFFSQVEF